VGEKSISNAPHVKDRGKERGLENRYRKGRTTTPDKKDLISMERILEIG